MVIGVRRHVPAALPLGKTRYRLYIRLGGPRAGLDGCGKISPPPEIDPRIFRPVASLYTDWAIPALSLNLYWSVLFVCGYSVSCGDSKGDWSFVPQNEEPLILEEWKNNLMSLAILFHFLCAQHVSDINISIIRSLRLCCWITTSVVLFSVRCVLEIWCGWFWVVTSSWSFILQLLQWCTVQ